MYSTQYGDSYKLSVSNKFIQGRRLGDGFETLAWIPKYCFYKKVGNYHIFKVKVHSAYDTKLRDAKVRLTDPWGFVEEITEADANKEE